MAICKHCESDPCLWVQHKECVLAAVEVFKEQRTFRGESTPTMFAASTVTSNNNNSQSETSLNGQHSSTVSTSISASITNCEQQNTSEQLHQHAYETGIRRRGLVESLETIGVLGSESENSDLENGSTCSNEDQELSALESQEENDFNEIIQFMSSVTLSETAGSSDYVFRNQDHLEEFPSHLAEDAIP